MPSEGLYSFIVPRWHCLKSVTQSKVSTVTLNKNLPLEIGQNSFHNTWLISIMAKVITVVAVFVVDRRNLIFKFVVKSGQ